jgi:hypothetical protein
MEEKRSVHNDVGRVGANSGNAKRRGVAPGVMHRRADAQRAWFLKLLPGL